MPEKRIVILHDPHPGRLGAAVPLPRQMVDLAAELAGQSMTLEQAMEMITPVAEELGGSLRIVKEYNYISFSSKDRYDREHFYRLICYK